MPPRDANGGTGVVPGASGALIDAPPPPPSDGPTADIVLTALNISFDTKTITGPAGVPFTLALVNKDAGTPHNVEFKGADGAEVWKGEVFTGVDTRVYDVGRPSPRRIHLPVHGPSDHDGTATIK